MGLAHNFKRSRGIKNCLGLDYKKLTKHAVRADLLVLPQAPQGFGVALQQALFYSTVLQH